MLHTYIWVHFYRYIIISPPAVSEHFQCRCRIAPVVLTWQTVTGGVAAVRWPDLFGKTATSGDCVTANYTAVMAQLN